MTLSARLAVCSLALFVLCVPRAEGSSHYPVPPGIDADEDAAFRGRYQRAKSLWHPSYLWGMRTLWSKMNQIAPVYFYRRTCGKGKPARQIIIRAQDFDVPRILSDDASQNAFLLHIRWLIEVYWRLIVPVYAEEPRLVIIVDFNGITWRTVLSNSMGIKSLIKKMNSAIHSITGRGMERLYILSAPSGFGSIWNIVTKFVSFRQSDVILVNNAQKEKYLLESVGENCLWEGFGGKSRLPLQNSLVGKAFAYFSQVDDNAMSNPNVIRLSPEAEHFALENPTADFDQILAAGAAEKALDALEEAASEVSKEIDDS